MATQFFLFAGEPSGDLHGSHLLKQLKAQLPEVSFQGVGGPLMRSEGLQTLHFNMEDFAVMGFLDVLKNLPKLIRQFYQISGAILENSPAAVILIDYPDFNLRLAKNLRKHGYRGKIVQYISPSVWAWRKNRVEMMAKYYDLLLTIYPFEADYFKESTLAVNFVGNPVGEYLGKHPYNDQWKERLRIPADIPIIGLFPGSRKSELERNLPLQLESIRLFLKEQAAPHAIAISCSAAEWTAEILQHLEKVGLSSVPNIFLVPQEYTYELMRDSHTALAKSGTVTLELALHHCPTVVIYRLSTLNYTVAKYLMRINLPFYCIVNLLLKKMTFPEFFGKTISPYDVSRELKKIYEETPSRKNCMEDCRHLTKLLQSDLSSYKAAKAILGSL